MESRILMIRSTIFNLALFMIVAFECLLMLPGLLLPRYEYMVIVRLFVHTVWFLERTILGLDFEVRGQEYLPKEGSFIVAAKHQSPYETMKLHILFEDPAVVLKKELLKIPLWGMFLAKSDPIAIDRSKGRESMSQISQEAMRIKAQERPIVIFPQGTRVHPSQTTKEVPYRVGVARMHEETGLPVIPMALNSGMFWPKGSWIKQPGKIIFEFLPPVGPAHGLQEIMKDLQDRLETRSAELADEAVSDYNVPPVQRIRVTAKS